MPVGIAVNTTRISHAKRLWVLPAKQPDGEIVFTA